MDQRGPRWENCGQPLFFQRRQSPDETFPFFSEDEVLILSQRGGCQGGCDTGRILFMVSFRCFLSDPVVNFGLL